MIAAHLGLKTSADTFNPVIVDFYEAGRLLARRDHQLLDALGLVVRRQDRVFHTPADDRKLFAGAREQASPASFDPKKLWAFEDHYMQQVPPKQKVAKVLPYLQHAGLVFDPPPCDVGPKLVKIVEAAGDRLKVFGDILDYSDFFVPDGKLPYDEKAFDKRIRNAPDAVKILDQLKQLFSEIKRFEVGELEESIKQFAGQNSLQMSQIVHPLRVALTGKGVGFGLFDTLAILGKGRSISRIALALARREIQP